MTWQTFWMEPTGRERRALRRYTTRRQQGNGWTCGDGWHDALAWTGEEVETVLNEDGYHDLSWPMPPPDDPRWPIQCDSCDYPFSVGASPYDEAGTGDEWQTWAERLYRRTDTEELRVRHWKYAPPGAPTAEPGAMFDGHWLPHAGPDGIRLMVRCPRPDGSPGPSHDWPVDEPSSSGGFWTRTGDPKQANVTASPSIAIGGPGTPGYYHGHLQGGVLTDHIG